MTYPIRVTVRHKYQSYSCRFPNGMSASSTNSAEAAVQRLADKCWGPGTHRVSMIRDCTSATAGEWAIWPVDQIEPFQRLSPAACDFYVWLLADSTEELAKAEHSGDAFAKGLYQGRIAVLELILSDLKAESIARRCAGERPISNAQGAEANIETIRRTA
jgi:hypothetical protein